MKIHIKDTDIPYFIKNYNNHVLILQAIMNDGWLDDVVKETQLYRSFPFDWYLGSKMHNDKKIKFYIKNEATYQ